jgi:hypothetical protein
VLFIAVMTVIAASFMTLGGLVSLVGGACRSVRGAGPTFSRSIGRSFYSMLTAIGGFVYLILAALEVPIIVYLFRYVNAINKLLGTQQGADLENALYHQAVYWKYVGILTIVATGIVIIALFIALVVVFSSGMGRYL